MKPYVCRETTLDQTSIDRLVCGCPRAGHHDGCWLNTAETIAHEAATAAADSGGHQLLAALIALDEAGYLNDLDPDDPEHLCGVLDLLVEVDLVDDPHLIEEAR